MKKAILSIAVLSAMGFSAMSQAAPTVGATGLIKFNGSINADSCVVHSAGAGSAGGQTLTYDMGSVSVNALGTEASPMSTGGTITTLPTAMDLQLECPGSTSVELQLTPTLASGKGIGVTGGAQGVQIMLVQGTQPLDFSMGPVTLSAPSTAGIANIALKAYYTLKASTLVSSVVTGDANGSAAYTLSYN
ncbi:type 1 fimbrial protein [Achromobacter aegrifaciens]|uniref:fimbrial protein n=1 Tax=Achromobacter aegrifaciens TaxID=1287736 RepID=UPI0027BA443E|nr:fimbrial protein [Achromobacter aegrifaciens]WLW63586.1 type 1 fimbrial protein [Achromobacter aegrifaciens]